MYYKCSVDKCPSTRLEAILHHFPVSETLAEKWLDSIGSAHLSGLSIEQLRKVFVCQKHFEAKFITVKNRLRLGARPTLFTESEIANGVPEKVAQKTCK